MTVTGKRSPKWAFFSRMVIPCEDSAYYLVRLRLIQTPWFGVYIHDIHEPDSACDPHDHPWTFISIVLRGGYLERLWGDPGGESWNARDQSHSRWSWHKMPTSAAHQILAVLPRTETLILAGARKRVWGFHTREGWVQWDEYEG